MFSLGASVASLASLIRDRKHALGGVGENPYTQEMETQLLRSGTVVSSDTVA